MNADYSSMSTSISNVGSCKRWTCCTKAHSSNSSVVVTAIAAVGVRIVTGQSHLRQPWWLRTTYYFTYRDRRSTQQRRLPPWIIFYLENKHTTDCLTPLLAAVYVRDTFFRHVRTAYRASEQCSIRIGLFLFAFLDRGGCRKWLISSLR